MAARTVFFGAVGTAGQRCTSTRRLLLHSSIADQFLEQLKSAYAQLKIGNPLDQGVLCGPLHTTAAREDYLHTIKQATTQGGHLVYGGESHTPDATELQSGVYVKPTIIRYPKNAIAKVMEEECFAPILHCTTFDALEEAIAINNSVRQGLSSTLFTKNMSNVFHWIGPQGSDCGSEPYLLLSQLLPADTFALSCKRQPV